MNPYMFVFLGAPASDNPDKDILRNAYIHIWVMAPDADTAESISLEYIKHQKWQPGSLEHAFQIQPSLIPQLGAAESALYNRMLQFGIAADFVAAPLVPGDPSDPIQIRQMES